MIRAILQEIRAPLILLVALILLHLLASVELLPSLGEMLVRVKELFSQHGIAIIGPISFLENLAIVNLWFPGAIVILAAMALTYGDPWRATITFVAIWIGSLAGLHASYLEGRLSRKAEKTGRDPSLAMSRMKNVWRTFALTFSHPQLASFSCYGAGVDNVSYRLVVVPLVVCNFLWNLFWGLSTYHFGPLISSERAVQIILVAYLVGWMVLRIVRFARTNRQI